MKKMITWLALTIITLIFSYFSYYLTKRIALAHGKKMDKARKIFKLSDRLSFDINDPDTVYLLPSALIEISGLSNHYFDAHALLAVEDENGLLYSVSKEDGSIIEKIKFGGNEDYEAVESIDQQKIAVINSKGDVYLIEKNDTTWTTKRINTILKRSHDTEGLTYIPSKHQLVLACKGKGEDKGKKRKLYFFDLDKEEILEGKTIEIDNSDIAKSLGEKKITLNPSAITYLEQEKAFLILASADKCVAVIDTSGTVLAAHYLNPKIYEQPEGICIDNQNNLYIACEGNLGMGKLFVISAIE